MLALHKFAPPGAKMIKGFREIANMSRSWKIVSADRDADPDPWPLDICVDASEPWMHGTFVYVDDGHRCYWHFLNVWNHWGRK